MEFNRIEIYTVISGLKSTITLIEADIEKAKAMKQFDTVTVMAVNLVEYEMLLTRFEEYKKMKGW